MKKTLFRSWFYLRQGYGIYWSFVFTGINVMTVTYFLAIERAPFLKEIFPTFVEYIIFLVIVGIPVLVVTGFIHYKKLPAYKSDAEVNVDNNPYTYKLPPGYTKNVGYPWQLMMSKILVKLATNEKITDDDIKKIEELQKKMEHLIGGGYIGTKGRKLSFKAEDEKS